ncbi:MAG: hypothetical protein V1725_04010 [archaeon]
MKGFELSVNFLVVIILGIAVLGGGIMLMYKVFNASMDISTKISDQNRDELNLLMSQGQLVACPVSKQEIQKGKTAILPLGILNKIGVPAEFTIVVDENIPNVDGATFGSITGAHTSFISGPYMLEHNKDQTLGIGIGIDRTVPKGTYLLGINVTCNISAVCTPIYDTPKRVQIVVT